MLQSIPVILYHVSSFAICLLFNSQTELHCQWILLLKFHFMHQLHVVTEICIFHILFLWRIFKSIVEVMHHSSFPSHSVSVLSNLLCEWKIDNSPWDVTLYAQCTTVIKWKSYTCIQHFQYLWKIDIFYFIFQLFLIFLTQFGHLSFPKMCFLWEYHETNNLHISELMPMLWHMAA